MTSSPWFSVKDISSHIPPRSTDDITGYVLPHAGTKYTGDIIRHTLQFQPSNLKEIRRVYIYYYPANRSPDVFLRETAGVSGDIDEQDDRIIISSNRSLKCHHELYVPFRTMLYYFRYWRMTNIDQIQFIPVNVRGRSVKVTATRRENITAARNQTSKLTRTSRTRTMTRNNGSFYIISADFSHHKPFQYAIAAENKAAHAIVTGSLSPSASAVYLDEIDDSRTFRDFISKYRNLSFQWIGRTRSPGESAVGYLSFLIRPRFQPGIRQREINAGVNLPDGIFVTCYDAEMNARECLGNWYGGGRGGGEQWSQVGEDRFIDEVVRKARTTSRLTSGKNTELPITRCVITYLFKDASASSSGTFIRGWHSIQTNAIYLPDVLLEHAKEDGKWITSRDTEWIVSRSHNGNVNGFDLSETLHELDEKAGAVSGNDELYNRNITLYTVRTRVKKIGV